MMKESVRAINKLKKNNAYVADYLNAYRVMDATDFAVMITGSWGSGKTEFVKRWAEALKKIDNDDKPEYLMISLNGINALDEIDSLLFRAAHPILGGKSVRIAGKVLSAIASGLKLTANNSESNSSLEFSAEGLKNISFDKWIGDAPIIIFDDIERCCVDIESLMGCFDDLLKNGKKLLLVCAEDEIRKRWTNDARSHTGRALPSYEEICTKVVGKRFRIEAEIEDLYGVLVSQVGCCETLSKFLIDNKETFVGIFNAVGEFSSRGCDDKREIHNYRAFKHALRDLNYWYGRMPKQARKEIGFLRDFSRPFVMLDYALLTTVLERKDLFKGSLSAEEQSNFQRLMSLGGIGWNAWINPDVGVAPNVMERMLHNEKIDKDELAQAVLASRHFLQLKDRPEWQQLKQWDYLDDSRLELLVGEVERKISKYDYVAAEEILHVFSLLGEMATFKVLSKTPETVAAECQSYVNHLVESDRFLLPDYDRNGHQWLDDHGLGVQYAGVFDNKPYYKAAEKIVLKAIHKVDAKRQSAWIDELTPEFSVYPGEFYSAIRDSSSRWRNEAVFNRIDVDVFYAAYCSLSNEDKNNVGRLLYSRVGRGGLEAENDFWWKLIEKLKADVEAYSNSAIPPSVFQKMVFARELGKKLSVSAVVG